MKGSNNELIRHSCLDFMQNLLKLYPPTDLESRDYYLYSFFSKLIKQDDKTFNISEAWTNFSQTLSDFVEQPLDETTEDYLTFLVDLLEADYKNWMDE